MIKLLSSVSTRPIDRSETWSRSSSPNSRMQRWKNTGFAPAASSLSALYLIKAHAAIAYAETSQSRHESMHMEANQANCMPFALKRNGLLWRVGGMYGCG